VVFRHRKTNYRHEHIGDFMARQRKPIGTIFFVILIFILAGFLSVSGEEGNEIPILQEIVQEGENLPGVKDLESSLSNGDQIEDADESTMFLSYSFSAPIMESNGEYHIPKMSMLRNQEDPGMPVIPVKNAQILLPQDEVLKDIEVFARNEVALDGRYLIKPAEKPITFGSDEILSCTEVMNLTIYSSNERYPGDLYSKVSVQTFRGFRILMLKLYPLHYFPAQRKITYYERIDVTLKTTYTGEKSPLYRGLAQDQELAESLVDNPLISGSYELKTEEAIGTRSLTDASESYDYIIITNNNLAPTFQSLADQRNISGIEAIVVRVEDIYADPDYDGSDNQTKIRNFIKDAFLNWTIEYVLLGGDDEIIPHRGCYGYVFSVSGPEEDNDIPTDLYYGGLDGNWNNDGDGRYGEMDTANGGGGMNGEESDIMAEVFVGRAPVNTPSEAQTFIDKVIFFEANPRPKHVTLHGETDSSGPYYLDYIKNGENGPHEVPGVESYLPSIYNITGLYERKGVSITKSIWEAEIANDTLFVNHAGHGFTEGYEIKEGLLYMDTDADDVVNTYYPIHLSIACYSGSFDGKKSDNTYVSDKDCIAEEYITNPSGGMVACILNSRFGWFISSDVTKYSGELDNEFYNQLFNYNEMRIGRTLQKTKEEFASDALTHTTYRWIVFEWNLLGDPALQIFGQDTTPPIADAGPDNSTGSDQSIMLDGSASTDDSGYIAWYNWTFGDGNHFNGSGANNKKRVHIYTVPGDYTVILNVSDAWGNWDNDTCTITVWDETPPIINLTIDDPKYRQNAVDNWNVTQTTSFNITAIDEYSGVNFTWYTIDGEYFKYESTHFNLSGYAEGPHNITCGGKDLSGNNGTGVILIVNLDRNPPTTELEIGEPKYRNNLLDSWNVSSQTPFILNSSDSFSGIAVKWFIIDGLYYDGTGFNLMGYDDGIHTIAYGSLDNLGHNESQKIITIYLDTTPPTKVLDIGIPKYRAYGGDHWNVTNFTIFNIFSNDDLSGVDTEWYIIDGEYFEGSTFTLDGYLDGMHTIAWGARDRLGNNETGNTTIVFADTTPPSTTFNIIGPQYRFSMVDSWNVTSQTIFNLTPFDVYSGVNFTWYTIDDVYFEGKSLDLDGYAEGMHIIDWGSQDYLGYNETKTITVWLDDSPPKTNLTIGSEKFPVDGFDGCNVTSSTTFTLSPQDYPEHNSGIKQPWYTVDGRYFEGNNFTLSLFGLNEGPHNITWGSMDNLGQNESGNHIVVYLDKLPPESSLEVGEPNWRDFPNEFYNVTHSTPITFNASDSYSQVAFNWYIINGEYFQGSSFNLSGYEDDTYTILYGSQDNLGFNESGNSLTVILDTTFPNSTIDIGTPRHRANETHMWNITSSTIFMIFSKDNSSGVETIWYLIDDNYHEDWLFNLNGFPDGNHTITYGARDRLGNNETGHTFTIWLDNSAPVTNMTIDLPNHPTWPYDGGNVTSFTQFSLIGNDKPDLQNPGINFTWYTIDGDYFVGSWFNLSEYNEGSHIITWGSMDNLSTNETGNLIYIWVDDSPPVTEITIDSLRFPLSLYNGSNVTHHTLFSLSGSDRPTSHNSGVGSTWYTIDGVYHEGTEFNLSGQIEGAHVITWGSMDNLNHNETPNSLVVYLDNIPPTTTNSPGAQRYRESEMHIWNVTQTTVFTLISDDNQSGVSFIWYTIDGNYFEGSDFMLTGEIDGLHNITWGAQDNLGNKEEINSIMVNLDTTSPVVSIYIGGEVPLMDERNVLNSSTLVTLSGDDGIGTGIDFIWYSLDGGLTYNIYESPFTVPLNTSMIVFGARDNLGNNASGIIVRVDVDDSEPPVDNGDGNGNGNGDGNGDGDQDDGDIEPSEFDIMDILKDYLYLLLLLIIIIVVLVVLLALARKRKGKDDKVEVKAEGKQETLAFQVEEESGEEIIEFKEDKGSFPPPPPPPT
jgi:hypothetical protein